jgi:hypothetical protein
MAYKYKNSQGKTYTLHARETALNSGKTRKLYFFSKEEQAGAIDKVPAGYEVSETKNGLPVLKRKE